MDITFIINVVIGAFIELILICIVKHICLIFKIIKEKYKPYFKLNLLKQVINIEILLLLLCISSIVFFFINKEELNLNVTIFDILVNVGCSIAATIVLSVIIYFKFLKHIPDETKKQIDNLLNDRLGYETTNHNAVLQKSDSMQNFLSTEHSEIKQNINSAKENISLLYCEFNAEKELKKLQYEYLKDNEKNIIDNINKISALGESLEKVNYENLNLKVENSELKQENNRLKKQLAQYQKPEHTNNLTQTMHL